MRYLIVNFILDLEINLMIFQPFFPTSKNFFIIFSLKISNSISTTQTPSKFNHVLFLNWKFFLIIFFAFNFLICLSKFLSWVSLWMCVTHSLSKQRREKKCKHRNNEDIWNEIENRVNEWEREREGNMACEWKKCQQKNSFHIHREKLEIETEITRNFCHCIIAWLEAYCGWVLWHFVISKITDFYNLNF